MTPFSLLAALAGLSRRETSAFLAVSAASVDSWTSGRRHPHPDFMSGLAAMIAAQERAADETLALIRDKISEAESAGTPLTNVVMGFPADDHEAQILGFPCVGAWQAMAARVVARCPIPVRLVPRGADIGTAAAIEAHGR